MAPADALSGVSLPTIETHALLSILNDERFEPLSVIDLSLGGITPARESLNCVFVNLVSVSDIAVGRIGHTAGDVQAPMLNDQQTR